MRCVVACGRCCHHGPRTVHLLVDHPQATLDEGTSMMFMLTQPLDLVRDGAVRQGANTY